MNLGKPSPAPNLWLRRLPLVAINLVFVGLLFGILWPFLGWAFDDADSLAERRDTLARYQAVAAQEDAVRNYARQVKESNSRGDLLEGASAGIVTAALQSRLKAMGEGAGVTVQSIQALPLKTLGVAGREPSGGGAASHAKPALPAQQLFGARIAFSGSLAATQRLAQAIETGPPLMLISSATMTESMNWRPPGENQQQVIQTQMDVYGGALAKDRP